MEKEAFDPDSEQPAFARSEPMTPSLYLAHHGAPEPDPERLIALEDLRSFMVASYSASPTWQDDFARKWEAAAQLSERDSALQATLRAFAYAQHVFWGTNKYLQQVDIIASAEPIRRAVKEEIERSAAAIAAASEKYLQSVLYLGEREPHSVIADPISIDWNHDFFGEISFERSIEEAVQKRIRERVARGELDLSTLGTPDEIADRMMASLPVANFWDKELGPFFDTAGLVEWLDRSRQNIDHLIKTNKVLSVKTEDGKRLYPAFQFSGTGELLPHLPEVLTALGDLGTRPWDAGIWLNTKTDRYEGQTAADLMRDGRPEPVLAAARRDAEMLAT